MTANELYEYLTRRPCEGGYAPRPIDYYKGNGDVFGGYPQGTSAAYWLARIVDATSLLKYPCFSAAADDDLYNEFNLGHEYQLVLPFKYLEQLDGGAYKESCSVPHAAVAHGFRNAVDTMRACHYLGDNDFSQPFHRMATEYLTYWGWNSIADNMLLLGPDIIPTSEHESVSPTQGTMSCWPGNQGVPGAAHGCVTCFGEDQASCRSCGCCPPEDPTNICCDQGTPDYYSDCCGYNRTISFEGKYIQFGYWVPSQDGSQRGDILTGRRDEKMYHIGVMERKEYGGIANFRNNSADRLKTIDKGLFFEWVQERNGWDYETMTARPYGLPGGLNSSKTDEIKRVRAAVPIMLDVNVNAKGGMPISSSGYEASIRTIKQLLWNGEGVALFSNVGFPNRRDSQGLAYPDRIWYTMYSIIGYDDRRIEFDECVYVLHCPLGDWITGGAPSWGPLPVGSFLVTETVLKSMVAYMNGSDYYECRQTVCPPEEDCNDPSVQARYLGCSAVPAYPNCNPYFCAPKQSAFGMAFALSLNDRFEQSNNNDELLHYTKNIPTKVTADLISESKAYCKIPPHELGECAGDDCEPPYLPVNLEFIWGNGKYEEDAQGNALWVQGNMWKDRDYKNRAYGHSQAHQDIETSPIAMNCSNDEGLATINIQLEYYIGYLKINVAKPPSWNIITLVGKGCF